MTVANDRHQETLMDDASHVPAPLTLKCQDSEGAARLCSNRADIR